MNIKTVEHKNNYYRTRQLKQQLSEFCQQNNIVFFDYQQDDFNTTDLDQVPSDRRHIVLMHVQDLIHDSQQHWEEVNRKLTHRDQQLLVLTDNLVEQNFSNIIFLTHPGLIGLKHFHVDPEWYRNLVNEHVPSRRFNCFMQRGDSNRQSWFYFLYNRGLLDQGYVSYLLYDFRPSNLTNGERFEKLHIQTGMNHLDHFHAAYEVLKNQIPYRNFEENQVLWDKILDSKYSLVLDSYATSDSEIGRFFSEKVARALMLPSLDLLFVQKHTLSWLSSLNLISYSHDFQIDHLEWYQRQTALLDILENNSAEYQPKKLVDIAKHNYDVLKTCYNTIQTLEDNIIEYLKL